MDVRFQNKLFQTPQYAGQDILFGGAATTMVLHPIYPLLGATAPQNPCLRKLHPSGPPRWTDIKDIVDKGPKAEMNKIQSKVKQQSSPSKTKILGSQ
ncbi:MAG: hypothetical protein EZS28_036071, partial [Streblomastix strix]